ncbi:COP9 signalosome complex subunit 7 [Penicillium chermesinum]|nr:COP9 signalosome complex subunit 7 [Penicillium chermesinum]
MDQAHSRALEALQPFLGLATSSNSTSPRFAAQIVRDATSSAHTYVFAELLETPMVQSLRSSDTPAEFRGHYRLLEIFASGSWGGLHHSGLPQMNDAQTRKLRLLTLISLASEHKPLTYKTLKSALSLSTNAELETLVTDAIYNSLITATLSPCSSPPTVNITAVAALRDALSASQSQHVIGVLSEWETRARHVTLAMDQESTRIKDNVSERAAKNTKHESMLNEATSCRADQDATATSSAVHPATEEQGSRGKKPYGRATANPSGSNKREADVIDQDDGFWEPGEGPDQGASRMDIDEGAGSSRGSRYSKRVVGRRA